MDDNPEIIIIEIRMIVINLGNLFIRIRNLN